MPSILFTNLYLAARTGSELHTLELAKYFKKIGWDVTCFTLIYAYPLQREFEQEGIKVVELRHEDELSDHYDVLFAQHRIVSEHVRNINRISFGKVIVSILGIVEAEENPPSFMDEADGFVFVSDEAKDLITKNRSISEGRTFVLTNYAATQFFQVTPPRTKSTDTPRQIAVISNHPPREVFEMASLAQDRGMQVDIFGSATRSVEVDASLIARYDVVVSIGRTAQYCLAAQTPFFCYDRFGGPGYISPDNIEKHARYNFSGRSEPIKFDASSLLESIISGYAESLAHLPRLRKIAESKYDAEALFGRLVTFIDSLPSVSKNRRATAGTSNTECREYLASVRHLFGMAQFFYVNTSEPNAKCSEDFSVRVRYRYDSDIVYELPDSLCAYSIVRFDPDDKPCMCRVPQQGFTPYNACKYRPADEDCFVTDDPIYFVTPRKTVSYSARPCPQEEIASYIRTLEQEVEGLRGAKHGTPQPLIASLKGTLRGLLTRA